MKKVYSIYLLIPENKFNNRLKFLISNYYDYALKHKKMFGFYAWTTKQSYVKEFFETRNSEYFLLIENCVDDDSRMLKMLTNKYADQKLNLHPYTTYDKTSNNKNVVNVISTKTEFIFATEFSQETMDEFGPWYVDQIYTKKLPIWYSLSSKLQYALYMLGYPLDPVFDTEEFRMAKAPRRLYIDELAVLLYLYKDLFEMSQ